MGIFYVFLVFLLHVVYCRKNENEDGDEDDVIFSVGEFSEHYVHFGVAKAVNFNNNNNNNNNNDYEDFHRGHLHVKRKVLQDNEVNVFAKEAVKNGKPVVFENAYVCNAWRALRYKCNEMKTKKKKNTPKYTPAPGWDPLYLMEVLGNDTVIPDVYRHRNATLIYFDDERSMNKERIVSWKPPFEILNMTVRDFFRNAARLPPTDDYVYLSLRMDKFEGTSLVDDVKDIKPLIIKNEEYTSMNIWIGQGGVTAQTHYDSFHNFYVQIHGKKTFYLYPPSAWQNLYLYPKLHPSYRQSQVPFDEDCDADVSLWERRNNYFNSFKSLPTPLMAELEPGDMLYLPPYWFHRVKAEVPGPSISVNIWSDSEEYLLANQITYHPLPFESHWSANERAIAVAIFIAEILEGDDDEYNAGTRSLTYFRQQCSALFGSRYYPLLKEFDRYSFDCFPVIRGVSNEISASITADSHRVKMKYSAEIRKKLNGIENLDIRQIILHNYMEELMEWAVGVARIPSLLQCYAAIV